jgi:hypothetical protein
MFWVNFTYFGYFTFQDCFDYFGDFRGIFVIYRFLGIIFFYCFRGFVVILISLVILCILVNL